MHKANEIITQSISEGLSSLSKIVPSVWPLLMTCGCTTATRSRHTLEADLRKCQHSYVKCAKHSSYNFL